MGSVEDTRFDEVLFDLLPHRPPMLLINQMVSVDERSSSSIVTVDGNAPFYEADLGVPAWIGLEYMGQTAALIAGYQLQQGLVGDHLGFLLGTRQYKAECEYFLPNKHLLVECQEKALVGDTLATFDCSIRYDGESDVLATANLSVFRKPKDEL